MALTQVAAGLLAGSITSSQISSVAASTLTGTQTIPKGTLPAGCILQVVQGTTTASATTTTSASWATTNLSASITPLSATSKILILGQHGSVRVTGSANGVGIRLVRGSTVITQFVTELLYNTTGIDVMAPFQFLDSPATTSSTTYSTEFKLLTGSSTAQINPNSVPAYITLMEVAA